MKRYIKADFDWHPLYNLAMWFDSQWNDVSSIGTYDVFENRTKSRKLGVPVLTFGRIGAGPDHHYPESAAEARNVLTKIFQQLGVSDYVDKIYVYADGGRGQEWWSASVRFNPDILNVVDI